jgi:hypothetical protein
MLRAGLFVMLLLAGAAPAAGDPSGTLPETGTAGFSRPIDLSAGFHPQQMPRAGEDAVLPGSPEPESVGATEPSVRTPSLPRPGLPGIIAKREHVATFRLQGVTLFGGSVAGSVDGRSTNILLSWPTNP